MKTPRALAALLAPLLLLVVASVGCGGDDDDDAAGGNDSPTATAQSGGSGDASDDGGNDSDSASGDDDEIDFGDGLVVVTIGGDRFEFDMNEGFNVCRDVFGGIQFAGDGTDGRPTRVSGWIPPANWETFDDGRYDGPNIEVRNEDGNSQWRADAERAEESRIPAGSSQVDSFEIDGLSASGTATFFDTFALDGGEPVEGSFEISCEA